MKLNKYIQKTALQIAFEKENIEIIEYLIKIVKIKIDKEDKILFICLMTFL